jgi:hypothetical protein
MPGANIFNVHRAEARWHPRFGQRSSRAESAWVWATLAGASLASPSVRARTAALLLMALAGGVVAAALLVSGRRKRGEPIPYAPFIALGAVATLLWQGSAFASLT